MTHASLFSGIGGGEIAASMMGWENLFHCEIQEFPRRVLEYWYPNSTSYEDITKTDFTPWRGRIDILTAGFPCQPFSCAGQRKGAEDDRYLWPEVVRAIREIQPSWVVGENVAGILTMVQPGSEAQVGSESALFGEDNEIWERRQQYVVETVCQDLEREGYSVQPFVIPACAVGAPHRRDRVWFVARRVAADPESAGSEGERGSGSWKEKPDGRSLEDDSALPADRWRDFPTEPPVRRRDDGLSPGVADLSIPWTKWRTESIKALGNAWVPQVAYEIFRAIEMEENDGKHGI